VKYADHILHLLNQEVHRHKWNVRKGTYNCVAIFSLFSI